MIDEGLSLMTTFVWDKIYLCIEEDEDSIGTRSSYGEFCIYALVLDSTAFEILYAPSRIGIWGIQKRNSLC